MFPNVHGFSHHALVSIVVVYRVMAASTEYIPPAAARARVTLTLDVHRHTVEQQSELLSGLLIGRQGELRIPPSVVRSS